jgi:hypothetical protein
MKYKTLERRDAKNIRHHRNKKASTSLEQKVNMYRIVWKDETPVSPLNDARIQKRVDIQMDRLDIPVNPPRDLAQRERSSARHDF